MDELIIYPEYEQLLERLKQLKSEASELIEERDMLLYHTCENIKTEYILKIGSYEYKLFEFECMVRRIKRKIELIQALINRQEVVYITQIELQLDNEFREYKKTLDAQMDEINHALAHEKLKKLSEDDAKKIKKLYRAIVKRLHPDLNPSVSDRERELFVKAVDAYENGDLKTIELIYNIIEGITDDETIPDGIEELRKKIKLFEKTIAELNEEIEKIKNSFPYNQQEFLADEAAVKRRRDELREMMEYCQEVYKKYEKRLNEMLG